MSKAKVKIYELDTADVKLNFNVLSKMPLFDPLGKDEEFCKSVEEHGIAVPITIAKDYALLDGYRRVLACRHLRIKRIIAYVSDIEASTENFGWLRLQLGTTAFQECTDRKPIVEGLVERTIKAARGNDPAETLECEKSWVKIELASGYNREVLKAGVTLLSKLDEREACDREEVRELGRRVRSTFRNKGLNAALRMSDAIVPAGNTELDYTQMEKTIDVTDA